MKKIAAAMLCAGTVILSGAGLPCQAQEFPARPVRVVVPWPPGGLVDVAARVVAKELHVSTGQPFVVDNKPGAGGVIGADMVAKAAPDGYTLTLTTSALNMNAALGQKLPFDAAADFAPIAAVAYAPSIVVIHPAVNARTVQELVALARSRPGKLTYASAGIGSPAHLSAELFKSIMGLDILHVPFRGAPQAIAEVMAGRVDLLFANATVALPQIKAATVRPLAVTGAQRFSAAPDLPTMVEAGVRDFEADQWLGIFAPRGTPGAVLGRLRAEIDKALGSDEVRAALARSGMTAASVASAEQFAAYVREDLAKWKEVVRKAAIKAE